MRWLAHISPRTKARVTGVLYLLNLLTGVSAMVLLGRGLRTQGDAVNTVAAVLYTAVTLLLLDLFWPVSPVLSVVAAAFSLLGCWLPPVGPTWGGWVPFGNFVFFGVYCTLTGLLILRSWFMPKAVGVLMLAAGVCWLTTLRPAFSHALSPFVMIGGLIGEGSLIFWLTVRGVDERRWRAQAGQEETVLAGSAGVVG